MLCKVKFYFAIFGKRITIFNEWGKSHVEHRSGRGKGKNIMNQKRGNDQEKREKRRKTEKKIPYMKNLVNKKSSKGIDSEWFSTTISKNTSKIKVERK